MSIREGQGAPEERSGRERRALASLKHSRGGIFAADEMRSGSDRRVTKGTRAERKASVEVERSVRAVTDPGNVPQPARPSLNRQASERPDDFVPSAGAPVSAPEQEGPDALDCGDNSCLFDGRGKGGMRTNGGCGCLDGLKATQRRRVRLYLARLRAALDERSEREEAETCARSPGGDE